MSFDKQNPDHFTLNLLNSPKARLINFIWNDHSQARIQWGLSEGVQLWRGFLEKRWSKYHYKRTMISPPAKRHLNGVSMLVKH